MVVYMCVSLGATNTRWCTRGSNKTCWVWQVLLRRQFESELESLNTPDALPDWSLRFCFKLFRVYTVFPTP